MNQIQSKIIAIVGPTASGKTSLSIKLAEMFNGEIVSVDSRQIYREFNIGTAKIQGENGEASAELLAKIGDRGAPVIYQGIPHYMIDICAPDQVYSLAEFKRDALIIIDDIIRCGKVPFLVGGTGLYVSAIIDNYDIPEGEPSEVLRRELEKLNNDELLAKLKQLDREGAELVDYKNKRRLVRALEVCITTGKTFSSLRQKKDSPFDPLILGLNIDKETLTERIVNRVEELVDGGLESEVENLSKKYNWDLPAMTGIDYREWRDYFDGKISIEKVKYEIIKNTRNYAKRQMTWFKKDKRIVWVGDVAAAEKEVCTFLGVL